MLRVFWHELYRAVYRSSTGFLITKTPQNIHTKTYLIDFEKRAEITFRLKPSVVSETPFRGGGGEAKK